MTVSIKPLVAGNWKMHGVTADLGELTQMVAGFDLDLQAKTDLLVCLPATLIFRAVEAAKNGALAIGGQDCHSAPSGAHTGDIAAEMIADAGGEAVIVGHSERRADHHESDEMVRAKAEAARRAGLTAIICVGETAEQRRAEETLAVLEAQLAGSVPEEWEAGEIVIAYEPVWAIGTGETPSAADIADAHRFMRDTLTASFGERAVATRLLYGGSVKPGNAAELLAIDNVDGALIGGASLKAADLLAIAGVYMEGGAAG